ncbi:hypothetical protein EJP82_01110 [Paenibacillus anaericanus]|uniref:XRE family transcriptional regulator n=1 Tax=Paenibacillus anaericanus TaxID=170367 RepID=A0A3S1DNN6_9BACL|nr:hypothetical protein [Paenibacillus anaericanus]RUT48571.1 hypothetical protein EJP82_01110 [Paenibacillus anaericanus]
MADTNNVEPLFKRIRTHISAKGVPLRDVAVKSGIPVGRFYRVMDGSTALHADEVEMICSVEDLELNPTELLRPAILRN